MFSCLIKFDGSWEWWCYELKVIKVDFCFIVKLLFVGYYNYFVLLSKLYEEVKIEIFIGIGVLVYCLYMIEEEMFVFGIFMIVKKVVKKEFVVLEEVLINCFMVFLFREVRKVK